MNRTKGEEAIAMAMFWGRTNHQSFKPKKQLKNVTPKKPTLVEAFKAGVKEGERKAKDEAQ